MKCKCDVCNNQYKSSDSDATYIYIFCSQSCEDKSYDLMYDESGEPSEYLKDDMSNL